MGEIINFQTGKLLMVNHNLNDFNEDESIKAQAILKKTKQTKKVNDPTRIILARNLGSILSKFGRELPRDELVRQALGIDTIKPQERLGRFQITSKTNEISESKKKYLSHSLDKYIKIAEIAADLTKNRRSLFINMLFDNTRFIQDADSRAEDIEPNATELIFDHLNLFTMKINETFNIKNYYEQIENYQAYPDKLVKYKDDMKVYNFSSDYSKLINTSSNEISQIDELSKSNLSDKELFILNDDIKKLKDIKRAGLIRKKLYSIIHSSAVAEIEDFSGPIGTKNLFFGEELFLSLVPNGFSGEPRLYFLTKPILFFEHGNFKEKVKLTITENMKETGIWNTWKQKIVFNEKQVKKKSWKELKSSKDFQLYNDKFWSKFSKHFYNCHNIKIHKDHKLDLSFFNKHKKNNTEYLRISPLSISSVREFMDIPRKNIKRERYDAFEDYYDVSRAVSPPTSMLAEVEINLFYDGYRTSFDYSIEKSRFDEDAMYYNQFSGRDALGDLGAPVNKEDERKPEDYYHTYSITRYLEKLTFELVIGFNIWRKKIKDETFQKANQKRLEIEKEIESTRKRREESE